MLESNSNKCQLELREQAKLPIEAMARAPHSTKQGRPAGSRWTRHKSERVGSYQERASP